MSSSDEKSTGIKQFKGEGFEYWKFRVQTYLEMKGVKHCLTADVPSTDPEKKAFMGKDVIAKHMIVSFIADEHLEVVQEKQTANEMWKALNQTFGKSGAVSQHLLRKKLNNLKMLQGENMTEFFSRFDKVVRELKAAGAKLEKDDVISHLTINLPASYDAIVTALENIPDLTLELVKSRLLAEEQKKKGREDQDREGESSHESGLYSNWNQKDFSKFRCHRCNKLGHISPQCPTKWDNNNRQQQDARSARLFLDPREDIIQL